jgi:GNAT superfamily N-acetyltransferase
LAIDIRAVDSEKDWELFFDLPQRVYSDNQYHVPNLIADERAQLDPKVSTFSPFYRWKSFIAVEGDRAVARVVVAHAMDQPMELHWGWWETENNLQANRLLFQSVFQWVGEKQSEGIVGPHGFTQFDKVGLLTSGFDIRPTISESYHLPYYAALMNQLGGVPIQKYHSYDMEVPRSMPPKISKLYHLLKQRYSWKCVVPKNKSEVLFFAEKAFELMQQSHAHLPGQHLLAHDIQQYYIRSFLPMIKKQYTAFVFDGETLIAFGVAVPSYAPFLQRLDSHWKWWSALPFLWHKHFHREADLMLIGVHPEYLKKGVPAFIFHQILQVFMKRGITTVHSNPELASNNHIRQLWKDYHPSLTQERMLYRLRASKSI